MPPDPPRWLRAYGARFSRAHGATDLSDKTKSLSAKLSDKLQMLVLLTGEIHSFSFSKMRLKLSSAKWRLFGLGLNELMG